MLSLKPTKWCIQYVCMVYRCCVYLVSGVWSVYVWCIGVVVCVVSGVWSVYVWCIGVVVCVCVVCLCCVLWPLPHTLFGLCLRLRSGWPPGHHGQLSWPGAATWWLNAVARLDVSSGLRFGHILCSRLRPPPLPFFFLHLCTRGGRVSPQLPQTSQA